MPNQLGGHCDTQMTLGKCWRSIMTDSNDEYNISERVEKQRERHRELQYGPTKSEMGADTEPHDLSIDYQRDNEDNKTAYRVRATNLDTGRIEQTHPQGYTEVVSCCEAISESKDPEYAGVIVRRIGATTDVTYDFMEYME
jgi:hypothetical protein